MISFDHVCYDQPEAYLGLCEEAVAQTCSVKKVFLEISQNSQENTCAAVSFLIKLEAACNFIKKETLAQVFSIEFCKICKNTFSQNSLGDCFF